MSNSSKKMNLLPNSLRINERINYYVESNLQVNSNNIIGNPTSSSKWVKMKKNLPFSQKQYLEQFLIDMEVTESEVSNLANSVNEMLKKNDLDIQGWWVSASSIEELYDNFVDDGNYFSDLFISETPLSIFFDCFEPLIRQARKELKTSLMNSSMPFSFEIIEHHLLFNIGHQLFEMLDRVMVLEMNVSRISGELSGNSPQERFLSFRNLLRSKSKQRALINEYPVLFRQVYESLASWKSFSYDFIIHLITDWDDLQKKFEIKEMLPIKKIHINAGDRHNGGRTVSILTFGSGEKIVYKPRNINVDVHFQDLLNWINDKLIIKHKTIKVYNKETHGWIEFVHHLPCKDINEVSNFYERIGSMLCLLYAVNAVDFHHENLIANGSYPVLIDLESLFHPESMLEDEADISYQLHKEMKNSVLNINMLPFKMYLDNGVIDISGVANVEGKESPNPSLVWTAEGTDEMRLISQKVKMGANQNAPKLIDGSVVQILDYAPIIEKSFRQCYQILMDNKDELLAEKSVIRAFSEDEVRLLFRPTASYSQLLRASFHPDFLRNQIDRDLLFNKLWMAINNHKDYNKLIPSELNALYKRDIPMFYGYPKSLDLWSGGEKVALNFFKESAMDMVLNKIKNLNIADCESQCWFIKASLASSSETDSYIGKKTINYFTTPSQQEASTEQLFDAAKIIGEKILKMAISNETDAHWLGLIMVDGISYDVQPLAMDLYSGMPGIALFLGAMYRETQDERYNIVLNKTLHRIDAESKKYFEMNFFKHMGAFSGWAGLMYVKHNLGKILDREDLTQEAIHLANMLSEHIDSIHEYDIIAGASGVIICLKRVYESHPSENIKIAIESLCDLLAEEAVKMPEGIGWKAHDRTPLAGFAHGSSGIALALLEGFEIIPKEIYRHTAQEALRYERSVFIETEGNWADLRELTSVDPSHKIEGNMVAWCNGAVGIGFSRLSLKDLHHDLLFDEEIKIAFITTLKSSFGKNHSLCHGDFGSLDFLLELGKNDENTLKTTFQITDAILSYINTNGIICGVPLAVENPGFMTGISGIGYQMLRLSKPHIYPSVLLLK